jgi:hypothetical protein
LAVEDKCPKLMTMLEWFCPGCGGRCSTSVADRADTLSGLCAAAATWKQLSADTQEMIDDATCRGNMPGLLEMRAADPPIKLFPRDGPTRVAAPRRRPP